MCWTVDYNSTAIICTYRKFKSVCQYQILDLRIYDVVLAVYFLQVIETIHTSGLIMLSTSLRQPPLCKKLKKCLI